MPNNIDISTKLLLRVGGLLALVIGGATFFLMNGDIRLAQYLEPAGGVMLVAAEFAD